MLCIMKVLGLLLQNLQIMEKSAVDATGNIYLPFSHGVAIGVLLSALLAYLFLVTGIFG